MTHRAYILIYVKNKITEKLRLHCTFFFISKLIRSHFKYWILSALNSHTLDRKCLVASSYIFKKKKELFHNSFAHTHIRYKMFERPTCERFLKIYDSNNNPKGRKRKREEEREREKKQNTSDNQNVVYDVR